MIRLAIFDLDGTILDTLEDLAGALNHALTEFGYPTRTLPEVRSFVGNGIRNLIRRGAPSGTPEETIDRLHAVFTAHYNAHCADKTRPYDGIPALLTALRDRGLRVAVVSNKPDYGVQELCKQHFDGLFDAATGERAGMAKKPAPDLVDLVLRRLGLPRSAAVYIGDSEVDIATARNAKVPVAACTWGFCSREELTAAEPDYLLEKAEGLPAIVQELNKK